ncbi:MAG: LysM peptidoglycan-binding domain-containing protein [Acidimicrobiales bacterium]
MRFWRSNPGLELAGLGCAACLAWILVFTQGRTYLAPPSAGDPAAWAGWYEKVGPLVAVFSLSRLVVLAALGLWTLAAFGLAASGLGRTGRLLAAAAARTLSAVRLPGSTTMVSLAVGLSVSAGALGACGTTNNSTLAASQVPVLFNPSKEPATTTTQPARRAPRGLESPRQPAGPTPTQAQTLAKPSAPPAGHSSAGPSTVGGLWVVRPGDDLWSIAADTLRLRLGRQPDRQEVATYWLQMIAANRSGLPHPDDPSLLYAGDVIILPPS